jgi:hypothetical protein
MSSKNKTKKEAVASLFCINYVVIGELFVHAHFFLQELKINTFAA